MDLKILSGSCTSLSTITESQEELQLTEEPIQFTQTTMECNVLQLLCHEGNML